MRKKNILSIFVLAAISTSVSAQNVNIPDANFKSYLVGNAAINTNGDTEIQVTEASAFSGTINCFNLSITDLTGVEAFTAITELICGSNNLSSLDVSANINLEHLFCNDNNNLNSLNLSANTALTELYCNNNNLNSLDVSANNNLLYLYCYNNNLNSLDASANNNLVEIECQNNSLSSIDVSTNTNLLYLYCSNNNLNSLDISANTALFEIECQNNNLSSLDVSANINLGSFRCDDNNLSSLNVANGDNGTSGLYYVNATNNPNLTCIQHDTGFNPTTNSSWTKDATASWSDNCNFPCTVTIPDPNFKAYLVGNTAINTNGDTEIQCSEASAFSSSINCSNLSISDLTGLEAFTQLYTLNIYNNSISTLDLSNNLELVNLQIGDNPISAIDVSLNTDLEAIQTSNTLINALDLTSNINLTYIQVAESPINSLNVTNGNNTILTGLEAWDCPNLTCISVDDVTYSTTNWINWPFSFDSQTSFSLNCANCTVTIPDANFKAYLVGNTSINTNGDTEIQCSEASAFTGALLCSSLSIADLTGIEAFTSVTQLLCNSNSISALDLSQNTALTTLNCGYNSLTNLNVSQNTALTLLYCNSNQLTALNIANGNNTNMNLMKAQNNPNLMCIQIDAGFTPPANWQKDATTSFSENCVGSGVGLNDYYSKNISIYPNPATNELFIDIAEGQINQIQIIDYAGRVVTSILDKQLKSIDVSNLAQGIYILKVSTENGNSTKQFIKK